MQDQPLVSINITTYNRAHLLPRCLESVLKQNYQNMEIVIVDDCSNDETANVLQNYKNKDRRIKYFRHNRNKKNAQARNTALQNSKGLYVAFMDDDDEWICKNKLKNQVDIFKKNDDEKLAIVCSGIERVMKNNIIKIEQCLPPKNLKKRLLKKGLIHNSTVMMKRKVMNKLGGFDTNMIKGVDSEFFRRSVVVHDYKVHFMKSITCRYYENHAGRMTIANSKKSYSDIRNVNLYLIKKYFKYLLIYPSVLVSRLKNVIFAQLKIFFTN